MLGFSITFTVENYFYFQCTLGSIWLSIDFYFSYRVVVSGLAITLVFPLEIQLFCVRGVMLNGKG